MENLIGKFVYFDYVNDDNYKFGQVIEQIDKDIKIRQIEQVFKRKQHRTNKIKVRNLEHDLEHETLKIVNSEDKNLVETSLGMSKCVFNPQMISITSHMKYLEQFINYYLVDHCYIDITAMKWYNDIQNMLKENKDFNNSLITCDELMYLNQLNYIDLYLIDKTLKVVIVSFSFKQNKNTEFEFNIDGYFLDDIKSDYIIGDNGKLLCKSYINLEY